MRRVTVKCKAQYQSTIALYASLPVILTKVSKRRQYLITLVFGHHVKLVKEKEDFSNHRISNLESIISMCHSTGSEHSSEIIRPGFYKWTYFIIGQAKRATERHFWQLGINSTGQTCYNPFISVATSLYFFWESFIQPHYFKPNPLLAESTQVN